MPPFSVKVPESISPYTSVTVVLFLGLIILVETNSAAFRFVPGTFT